MSFSCFPIAPYVCTSAYTLSLLLLFPPFPPLISIYHGSATNNYPAAIVAGTAKGRKDLFSSHNQSLDYIQKNLEAYLETKRQAFPRFYFLSDDELLEILAQTRDPRAVQPHLRKCFDCIQALQFGEGQSIDVLAMTSPEGETVSLGKA